jgi:hypothetical protein
MNEISHYETYFKSESSTLMIYVASAYLPLEQSILDEFKANLNVRKALSVYGIWIAGS